MKKDIKILVRKLSQDQKGKLSGGFAAIKGGFQSFSRSLTLTNDGCTNSGNCNTDTNIGAICAGNRVCAS